MQIRTVVNSMLETLVLLPEQLSGLFGSDRSFEEKAVISLDCRDISDRDSSTFLH